jgi:hypothetical protein
MFVLVLVFVFVLVLIGGGDAGATTSSFTGMVRFEEGAATKKFSSPPPMEAALAFVFAFPRFQGGSSFGSRDEILLRAGFGDACTGLATGCAGACAGACVGACIGACIGAGSRSASAAPPLALALSLALALALSLSSSWTPANRSAPPELADTPRSKANNSAS